MKPPPLRFGLSSFAVTTSPTDILTTAPLHGALVIMFHPKKTSFAQDLVWLFRTVPERNFCNARETSRFLSKMPVSWFISGIVHREHGLSGSQETPPSSPPRSPPPPPPPLLLFLARVSIFNHLSSAHSLPPETTTLGRKRFIFTSLPAKLNSSFPMTTRFCKSSRLDSWANNTGYPSLNAVSPPFFAYRSSKGLFGLDLRSLVETYLLNRSGIPPVQSINNFRPGTLIALDIHSFTASLSAK